MSDRVTKEERIARLKRMQAEYDDPNYDGPAWLRCLGQFDVQLALIMEGEC